MKSLVLGHRGFLGSHMVSYLKNKGHRVVIGSAHDLRDYKDVLELTSGVDFVFSFAANMGGVGYFSKANYYPVIDNFLIDINVLRACEKNEVKRIFYPSSACAYNIDFMNSGADLEEDMLEWSAKPDQMYGWEKLTMTKLAKHSPLDIRVGVLHTIYGEGQEYKGDKAKFPPQIAYKCIQAVKTKNLEVWGNGEQTRTFLHVDDAMNKIYEVMMNDVYYGEVNIGSDKEVSVKEIVNICCTILNIKPTIIYNKDKPTGPVRRRCNNDKFNKHYKARDQVKLEDGFRRIIYYIQNHEL